MFAFWTAWSSPSLAELRRLGRESRQAAGNYTVVFAINDGDDPARARQAFDAQSSTARLVIDPKRDIARTYGIACWPTTIVIGPDGRAGRIQIGLTPPSTAGR